MAVVDCDFLNPILHEFWLRETSPGLSSVLVGALSIDDVFDYRMRGTGRFLTVTAGEDSARRAHLLATPPAEQAIRRLVDFAEIVLVNVGPLSEPAARSAVALCDAIVVVTAADRPPGNGERPAPLHGLQAPIVAWTPDLISTLQETLDEPAAPADPFPSWIDDAQFDAVSDNGLATDAEATNGEETNRAGPSDAAAHDSRPAPIIAETRVSHDSVMRISSVGADAAKPADTAPRDGSCSQGSSSAELRVLTAISGDSMASGIRCGL